MSNKAQEIKEMLEAKGIPVSAADRASRVLAKDDASLSDLGRSEQDKKNISDAWQWLVAKRKGAVQ